MAGGGSDHSGESGAGKTESAKYIIRHVIHMCRHQDHADGSHDLEDRILQVGPLVPALLLLSAALLPLPFPLPLPSTWAAERAACPFVRGQGDCRDTGAGRH